MIKWLQQLGCSFFTEFSIGLTMAIVYNILQWLGIRKRNREIIELNKQIKELEKRVSVIDTEGLDNPGQMNWVPPKS